MAKLQDKYSELREKRSELWGHNLYFFIPWWKQGSIFYCGNFLVGFNAPLLSEWIPSLSFYPFQPEYKCNYESCTLVRIMHTCMHTKSYKLKRSFFLLSMHSTTVHQLTAILSCHCWYSKAHFWTKCVRLSSVTPDDGGTDDFFSLS